MNKCQRISAKIEGIVEQLTTCSANMLELKEQPKSLNQNFTLSVYQVNQATQCYQEPHYLSSL